MRPVPLVALLVPLAACAASPSTAPTPAAPRIATPATDGAGPPVAHWGGMREVLREGRSEGRVALEDVVGPRSVGVGATAGLAGEITVVGGRVHVAEVVDAAAQDGVRVRGPAAGEHATLLVLADVDAWSEHGLPDVADLAALEASVRAIAEANGIDPERPFPFRVEGTARSLRLHVIDRVCPIAHPDGPPPWRWSAEEAPVVLVGFHAEGSAGKLTHHGRASHVHAVVAGGEVSGHVDDVAFAPGARLFLPGH